MGRTVAIGLIAPQIPAELVEELAPSCRSASGNA